MNNAIEDRVIGFFVAKGLLIDPNAAHYPTIKLSLFDVLEVAAKVEPRVLEVLPAALLSFPKSFLHWEALPEELHLILEAIRRGENRDNGFGGIQYKDMRRWAERQLSDRRTKPVGQKRRLKSFRFRHDTIAKLERLASRKKITETEILESLVSGAKDD